MRTIKAYLWILMIGLALPLQAQTEIIDDDESTEDNDTLATDSLLHDSLCAKGDTLPWPCLLYTHDAADE